LHTAKQFCEALGIYARATRPIHILLADTEVMLREGLRLILEQEGMVVIGEASDGQEALRLAHAHHPDVVVLDFVMPYLNGLETARRLREALPQTKIILLTMLTEQPYLLEALRVGAVGYVLKTQAAVDIVQAIHDAMQGMIYLNPRVANLIVQAFLDRIKPATGPADLTGARDFTAHRGGTDDEGDCGAPGPGGQNRRVASDQPDAEARHS
jgi:DNA-binding NarL/FixJ family response regulator